jgi:hypothetical protein
MMLMMLLMMNEDDDVDNDGCGDYGVVRKF